MDCNTKYFRQAISLRGTCDYLVSQMWTRYKHGNTKVKRKLWREVWSGGEFLGDAGAHTVFGLFPQLNRKCKTAVSRTVH